MKLLLSFLLILFVYLVESESKICYDKHTHCHSTNYESYVDCVRSRSKRSTDCESSCDSGNCIDTCNECDCSSCNYNSCNSGCNSCCSSCCSNYMSCRTNHCCHKTCHAQCQSSNCRSSCRKNCFESVKENSGIIQGNSGDYTQNSSSSINNENKHNITTIIHLNNIINNTNVIDIPIIVNNTNTQNVSLYEKSDGYYNGASTAEKCCTVVGPRQCVSDPKPRCFHYRSKQCGAFCSASIVHKEQQQVCESIYPGAPPNCRQQIYYIPQPQPRCVYQSNWPYVSCGIQKSASCQGCYSHYVDQRSTSHLSCPSQCFDEGYDVGPLYRQGPIFRPTYGHAPCYGCYGYENPYGGYDMNRVYPPYGQFPPPAYPYGVPAMGFPGGNYPEIPVGGDPSVGTNSTEIPAQLQFDPMINVGPDVQSSYFVDPYRAARDVEIEIKYEPAPQAQAEVRIKTDNSSENSGAASVKIHNTTSASIKLA